MSIRSAVRVGFVLAILLTLSAAVPRSASAQLNGFNIKGDAGLDAGTQAPPGGYYGMVFYRYGTDTIKDLDGNRINTGNGSLNQFVFAPLVSVVTRQKVLGANYGFAFVPAIVNLSIESARFGQNPGPGLGDTYVQPINLGWHMKQADVVAGYAFFAPTGRYAVGADDNTGLDMWGHELTVGTTAFFDEKKTMDVSTLAAVEFHGKKRNSGAGRHAADARRRPRTQFRRRRGQGGAGVRGAVEADRRHLDGPAGVAGEGQEQRGRARARSDAAARLEGQADRLPHDSLRVGSAGAHHDAGQHADGGGGVSVQADQAQIGQVGRVGQMGRVGRSRAGGAGLAVVGW